MMLPAMILLITLITRPVFFERAENLFLDSHIKAMELPSIDQKIIIILGSDRSAQEIGTWPWERSVHAQLIDNYLGEAKVVALDMLLSEKSSLGGDRELTEAIAENGSIVLGYADGTDSQPPVYSMREFVMAAAGEGYTNGYVDSDGIVRKYRMVHQDVNGTTSMSFIAATLMTAGYDISFASKKNNEPQLILTSPQGNATVIPEEFRRFSAPDGAIEIYEYIDVLNGKYPPETFKDAIVIVGFSCVGATDVFATATGMTLGAVYNADSLYTALTGINPPALPTAAEILLIIAMYVICALLTLISTSRLGNISREGRKLWIFRFNFIIPTGIIIIWLITARLLFKSGTVYLPSFSAIIATVAAFIVTTLYSLIKMHRELNVRSLPIDSLLGLSERLSNITAYENFAQYLMEFETEIRLTTGITVLNPCFDSENPDYKNFPKGGQGNLVLVMNCAAPPCRNRVLLELPFLESHDSTAHYALLGFGKGVAMSSIKSAATLVVTAYVYFNAKKDSDSKSETFLNLLKCMVAAVDAKDPITSGHSQRVSVLAGEIAEWMGLSEAMIYQAQISGLIHDIGKLGMPDSILGKPAPLSDSEITLMKNHPAMGAKIMEAASLKKEIFDGILYHHEKLDGKGYPYGLSGDEVSEISRIIKIADVYDALLNKRQYKKAWSVERALLILFEGRGTEFDPDLVDLMIARKSPPGWVPVIEPKAPIPPGTFVIETCLKKAAPLLGTFPTLEKFSPLMRQYPSPPDLNCRESFGGVAWYEGYSKLLPLLPVMLDFQDDISLFALKNQSGDFLVYLFLRGFLTAGLLTGVSLESLLHEFGEPVPNTTPVCWNVGRMMVYFEKEKSSAIYIMKSILDDP